jgi:glycosidase
MNKAGIYHHCGDTWCYAVDGHTLHIRIRTAADDIDRVELVSADPFEMKRDVAGHYWASETGEMTKAGTNGVHDFWEIFVTLPYNRLKYWFLLHDGNQAWEFGEKGLVETVDRHNYWNTFIFPYLHESEVFRAPDWVAKTVWYQIFPERFNNGNPALNPPGTRDWQTGPVKNEEFYGGDLSGIVEKLDHIASLGFNGIYLTPIFESPSAHKYDTTDYLKIDPAFGDEADLRRLADECHRRGIRIILDAVFNHSGRQFAPWLDVLKNGEKSHYREWFVIDRFPLFPETTDRATADQNSTTMAAIEGSAADKTTANANGTPACETRGRAAYGLREIANQQTATANTSRLADKPAAHACGQPAHENEPTGCGTPGQTITGTRTPTGDQLTLTDEAALQDETAASRRIHDSHDAGFHTFAFSTGMPKLNTSNPETREYLLTVAEHYIREFDIDGWRLDVANEIPHDFWRAFRSRVKALKSDAFIVGEIWHNSMEWLKGDQYDAVMNYHFGQAIENFLTRSDEIPDARALADRMTTLEFMYPAPVIRAGFNLLDSHDTMRLLDRLGGNLAAARQAWLLFALLPGAPCFYYGSEFALPGGADPDCRRCMPWGAERDAAEQFDFIREIVNLRKDNIELVNRGARSWIFDAKNGGLFGLRVMLGERVLVTIINRDAVTLAARDYAQHLTERERSARDWPAIPADGFAYVVI